MSWPPYQLLDRDYLAEAEEKNARLERLYHVGQKQAWDGRAVLAELLERHDGVQLAEDQRTALAQVFSTILWGELAAWSISADLALRLDDPAAKMAATGQAFDEARHFYVMRDYLGHLGCEIPRLDGYTTAVLRDLLETDRLVDKLLGMQLIVEVVALTLFRQVAASRVEPVLADLMPYFERDEARHVGLGVLYLPRLLQTISAADGLRLKLLQIRIVTMIGWGTHLKRPFFEALGIDSHASFRQGMRLSREVLDGMRGSEGVVPRGVMVGTEDLDRFNDWAISLLFPRPGAPLAGWHRAALGLTERLARLGDRALRSTL